MSISEAAKKQGGLAGVVAGESAICTCGTGNGLNYYGYAIEDLDGNGREELIITNGQGQIWDLYTLLEDGTPVHLHSQENGFPVH